jgi:hypothetical protein
MNRRGFIIIASAGVAALAIPALVYSLHESPVDAKLFRPQSLGQIWDTDTMNIVGLNYMLKVPKENRERILVKRLTGKFKKDTVDLAVKLDQQIKEDFISGNTVMVDGWILSVTEARQCALFSFTLQKS